MKIAVVGSGISGLACAHVLSRAHEVHVFEAEGRPGGHTHTVDVDVPSGRYAVDTGFIVFNDRTYPRFIRLMESLGVASQPSSMGFSVKVESSGLEYNGADLDHLFVQRRNLLRPSFYRMLLDVLRFHREAPALLERGGEGSSMGAYLEENRYSRAFREQYLYPMGAAIWSAPAERMREFPAAYFVRFFKNHGMLSVDDRPQWRAIRGGSRSYLGPLTKPFAERLHTGAPVLSVRRSADGVTVKAGGQEARFDQVVLAGHADQMLAALADADPVEREVLGAFPYQENRVLLHTDVSVLPRRRRAWASWNYFSPARERDAVAVTYNMNILQSLEAPETFCVSLNLEDRVDPAQVLRRLTYHHPVYTAAGVAAQARWSAINGKNRTHFCGAYWGFGFHEDGVKSAWAVCEALGVRP